MNDDKTTMVTHNNHQYPWEGGDDVYCGGGGGGGQPEIGQVEEATAA